VPTSRRSIPAECSLADLSPSQRINPNMSVKACASAAARPSFAGQLFAQCTADRLDVVNATPILLLSILPNVFRFEDHLLHVSRQDISADVPMRFDISAVAPRKGVGHRVCHELAENRHGQLTCA